jgi:hypothetical protein
MGQPEPCAQPVNVAPLPSGTSIHLPASALFVSGRTDLSPCGQYMLTGVAQAMLDPRLMQVVIEPEDTTTAGGSSLSLQRADTVKAMLSNVGFTGKQPPVLVQPATTPSPGTLGINLLVAASG